MAVVQTMTGDLTPEEIEAALGSDFGIEGSKALTALKAEQTQKAKRRRTAIIICLILAVIAIAYWYFKTHQHAS